MASKYAKEKFSFRLNLIEIMAMVSFLFMITTIILYTNTENPREFIVNSVRDIINNNSNEEVESEEGPRFEFDGSGNGSTFTPKVIFAKEDSLAYKAGMQKLVEQGLLPSIPISGDGSYFYFEDLERDEKVFIARLDTREEENCITSNELYTCMFYDFEELIIFYGEEKEIVFDNSKEES
jgi:hypothetical protein